MAETENYDAVVLGSGEAGKYIAWHLASEGKKVALIERRYIGGSCPNIACLPSKNIIHSAKVASYLERSGEFGVVDSGAPPESRIDMTIVRQRKRAMVDGLVQMHLNNFKKSGAEIVMGTGRFVGERTIEVSLPDGGTRVVRGEMLFLSTGTRTRMEAIPGLIEAAPLTHIEALELDVVPQHLLILGGGFIALEFAQAMRRFGSRVTIVERNPRLALHEDVDVSDAIESLFADEGIDVVSGAHVSAVSGKSGETVQMHVSAKDVELSLEGSHLMVATGRTPNTENIGLDIAGVAVTDRGYIQVNERLETSAPGVWAVGDCAGSPHFTHIALDDFRVVRENLAGRHRVTANRQVPSCVFIDPELARVGLNETQANEQGVAYRLAKIPTEAVLRTRTLSETRGFLKALVGAEDDKILGFTGFGIGAGELLPPVQLAMSAGLPYTALRDLVITHPTLSEGLMVLFGAVPKK
jgi:pyruvate/2-oxoglutarate dehydrogenase complex dihydrolipoamide dehydrogenase (E3) component